NEEDENYCDDQCKHKLTERSLLLGVQPAVLDRHAGWKFYLGHEFRLYLSDRRSQIDAGRACGHGISLAQPVTVYLGLSLVVIDGRDLVETEDRTGRGTDLKCAKRLERISRAGRESDSNIYRAAVPQNYRGCCPGQRRLDRISNVGC